MFWKYLIWLNFRIALKFKLMDEYVNLPIFYFIAVAKN